MLPVLLRTPDLTVELAALIVVLLAWWLRSTPLPEEEADPATTTDDLWLTRAIWGGLGVLLAARTVSAVRHWSYFQDHILELLWVWDHGLVLFETGGYPIHTFGVMVATGFLTAMWWCRREAERLELPVQRVMDLTFWLMIWGLIGARVLFILVNYELYAQHPVEILYIWKGGLVWYGGFLTAFAAAIVLMRRYALPVLPTVDLVTPGVMYGLAFGRLGCLSAGDDHGKLVLSALGEKAQALAAKGLLYDPSGRVSDRALDAIHAEGFARPWWALEFGPQSLIQRDLIGLPVYPTQILMSLYCFAIFAILVVWRRYKRFEGELVAVMLMLYAVARFFLEYWRGDLGRGFWFPGVSTSQGISVLVFLAGLVLYVWLLKSQGPRTDAPKAAAAS